MISVADLKVALRVTHANDDTYIEAIEAGVVAIIERAKGVSYAAGTATEYVRGDDTDTLWLTQAASAVTTVTERAYPGADTTVIAEADDDGFVIRGAKLIRKGGSVWSSGMEYEVAYTKNVTVPDDLLLIVYDLVSLWYSMRLPVALGTVAPPVRMRAAELLAGHRRPRA